MVTYPNSNKKLPTSNVPKGQGHVGEVVESGVEGTAKYSGKDSIGMNSTAKNKKSAGQVGATNMNAA